MRKVRGTGDNDRMTVPVVVQNARGGVWSPGRRVLTAGIVLTITLVAFEGMAVATILPDVKDDLGGIGWYGWVFSAFFLGQLVGTVIAGRAADRSGPRRPFVTGLVLFALGLLACGFAPNMPALVAARAVQGLGGGAIPAIAYVLIGRAYPTALQARMFAVLSSAWVLPAVVGPALSGAVADTIGWRWVFLGLLPLVAVAGAITAPLLRTFERDAAAGEQRASSPADALVVAVGAGLVLAAVSSRSLLAGPPIAAIGLLIGARAYVRLMPPGTVRLGRGLPAAIGVRGITTFAFFGTDAFVTLALTSERGASASLAGFALTGAALMWTTGSWIQERNVERIGPRTFVRVGAAVIVAGALGMIVATLWPVPVAVGIAAWSVGGLGMGLAYAPLSLVVLAVAPEDGLGRASGALQLSDTLGVALGTGASGAIVAAGNALGSSRAGALAVAFGMCAAVAAAASVAAARLPVRLRSSTP